jgi:hypothetical protein
MELIPIKHPFIKNFSDADLILIGGFLMVSTFIEAIKIKQNRNFSGIGIKSLQLFCLLCALIFLWHSASSKLNRLALILRIRLLV